jgi:uncharacterized protein YbjQ (UPF0145 family)
MAGMQIVNVVLGMVIGLAAVGGVIWKVMLPQIKELIADRTSNHEKRLAMLERNSEKDLARLDRQEAENKAMMAALFAILGHLEEGNCTGEIKDARAELQRLLIGNIGK